MGEDNNNKIDSLSRRVCELEAALEKAHQSEIRALYNESLYRIVTENMTDVIWKVRIDSPDKINYISPSVTNLLGYSVEEALSKTMLEIFTRESFDNAISVLADELACIKKGRIDRHKSMTLHMNLRHKNGSLVNAEVNYVFILGNDGNPTEILAVGRDVTERRRAEVLLRQSEQKYATLVEKGNDGIVIIQEGILRFANSKMEDLMGYPLNAVIGRKFTDFISPEYRIFTVDNYKKRLSGERAEDAYEIQIVSRTNQNIPIEIRATAIEYEGQPADMAVIRDITVHKKFEEALKLSEQNFHNSLNSSPMGILITDIDFKVVYVNQKFLDTFGYENIDQAKAHPPQEYYTPKTYAEYTHRKERRLRGESNPDKVEIEIVRKDGNKRRLQIFLKQVLWDGKPHYQTIYEDITESKLAEEKLFHAAQQWRTTFDSITDLIAIHDKENRIVRVNRAMAAVLKTTPQELIGRFCHEAMHGLNEPPDNCPHLLMMKTGKQTVVENFNPNSMKNLSESASPLFNQSGEITGSVVVARDITQQKQIEEQLILSDRLVSIGELSSGIAHELNNPLTSVIGFSQLLLEGDVPANMRENLETIHEEAQRAAGIVKNLLTFGRKHEPVKQLSQVNTVIEDVLTLRSYELKVNNIEVEKYLEPGLPQIMMDHFQIQQVFLNIIVNAEAAMLEAHQKGKLTITTTKTKGYIRATVKDDGPGISKENLKKIFNPFFTTKEVGKGTGLGLSICHGIVNEHNGLIYAMSEKGAGATFVVELPLVTE